MVDVRIMTRFPGTLGPLIVRPNGTTHRVAVRDFSIVGVGLLSAQSFPVGTTLVIESGAYGKPVKALSAVVRHATYLPGGEWLLGCQFSRNLSLSDLNQLG